MTVQPGNSRRSVYALTFKWLAGCYTLVPTDLVYVKHREQLTSVRVWLWVGVPFIFWACCDGTVVTIFKGFVLTALGWPQGGCGAARLQRSQCVLLGPHLRAHFCSGPTASSSGDGPCILLTSEYKHLTDFNVFWFFNKTFGDSFHLSSSEWVIRRFVIVEYSFLEVNL